MSNQIENFTENKMSSLIESSFGCFNSLDKKFMKKASFIAMKTIMSNVIKLTTEAINNDNNKALEILEIEKIEKKVFEICTERGIIPQKDKGLLTGYALFCKEQREQNKEQFSGKSLGEVSKELSQLWKKLTIDDKDEYKTNAKNTPPSDKKNRSDESRVKGKSSKNEKSSNKSNKSNKTKNI
jgi:hypothetical protein